MKIQKKDFNHILDIVEDSLKSACETFGLTFKIDYIYVYGSQISNKKDPKDIDIFVKVNSIRIINENQFLNYYGPTPEDIDSDDLMEIVYEYLHEKQALFNQTPIDINFRDYDFDLDGDYFQIL